MLVAGALSSGSLPCSTTQISGSLSHSSADRGLLSGKPSAVRYLAVPGRWLAGHTVTCGKSEHIAGKEAVTLKHRCQLDC